MNVTLKPAPESYELLSTGVMDGTLFPAESVEGFKIDKVIKYATRSRAACTTPASSS
jgi:TRAP-type C4-dicarboxylate transport system substrate-binding protein